MGFGLCSVSYCVGLLTRVCIGQHCVGARVCVCKCMCVWVDVWMSCGEWRASLYMIVCVWLCMLLFSWRVWRVFFVFGREESVFFLEPILFLSFVKCSGHQMAGDSIHSLEGGRFFRFFFLFEAKNHN